ncbi:MAG: hypothetical protein PQJ49_12130 [Sphaerochaetaceae bacterium]|nr:hypothetical protein [Sphaerochaetaceae bacterium]
MKVTVENYQELAKRTMASKGSKAADGAHMALGFTTEIGEMNIGILQEDLVNIREEHGDTNWYIANACNIYGLNFTSLYRLAVSTPPRLFLLHDLVDLHKREFAYGKEMDINELKEQLITLIQKLLVTSSTYGFSYEESLQLNIDKLAARYGDKFSEFRALNRDLNKEQKILEG